MGFEQEIWDCEPVMSCAAARQWETGRLSGDTAVWAAMKAAGAAVAEQILLDYAMIGPWPEKPALLVLAGKGHNGGDALLAATGLRRRMPRASVMVVELVVEKEMKPLVRRARDELKSTGPVEFFRCADFGVGQWLELLRQLASVSQWTVSLDGLLGMQGRPPLREPLRSLVHMLNDWRGVDLKVAVDLPTGIFADDPRDCLRADLTCATGIAKAPLFTEEKRHLAGRLRYLPLGFFDTDVPQETGLSWVAGPGVLNGLRRWRDASTHKGQQGHVFIFGGSRLYPGAVMMNVRAALRSGVGLVTAFVPESLVAVFAATAPEAIWVGWPETPTGSLALEGLHLFRQRSARATAVLAGSGMTADAETAVLVQTLLRESTCPWVLDADALTSDILAVTEARGDVPTILTPHRGEYRRLAGDDAEASDENLAWLCHRSNVVTILKDSWTRVSGGDHVVWIPTGNAVLARGGSGDLLAGLVAGLLAESPSEPLMGAIRGTYWHGQAADCLARTRGQRAVVCTDLLEYLACRS